MGFSRRFGYDPGNEVLTQIEGVAVIDLPPPAPVEGVQTGVVCLVGEFQDMTYCSTVDGNGAVSALYRPVEGLGAQDILNKTGGFDETIGDFGDSDGNGFVAYRSKKYNRIVFQPVFLCSNYGFRFWRELPLCAGQTNVLPVVPVQGGVIEAGREFKSTSNGRVRVARKVVFTALDPITTGTGGATTNAAAAATQTFTVAAADFSAVVRPSGGVGIKKGDIIVIGNNNAGARQPLPSGGNLGAGTYRVAADASSGSPTVLTLENLDGANFAFVTATTIPYRIHISSDADSAPVVVIGTTTDGGYKQSEAGGSSVQVRLLTNFAGVNSDGTWTANTALTPLIVPTAMTGSSWDALSSLGGKTHPTQTAAFTSAVQAPNAPAHASIDVLYTAAMAATIGENYPMGDINCIMAARTSATIRSQLKQNVLDSSAQGRGREAIIAPELDTYTSTAAIAASSPGVGAVRGERVWYAWPGYQLYVPEAVNFRIKTADGLTTTDGYLDVRADNLLASIVSNLPPERNPGQLQEPVPTLMSVVAGFQRGLTTPLAMNDYIALRAQGVVAMRLDRKAGPVFQSGVTTSLTRGQKNINRIRMQDFIDDSLVEILMPFSKDLVLPRSNQMQDSAVGEVYAFLESLMSRTNPASQRIDSYSVDDVSGNTAETRAANMYVILVKVKMLSTADFIVLKTEVGNGVVINTDIAGLAA